MAKIMLSRDWCRVAHCVWLEDIIIRLNLPSSAVLHHVLFSLIVSYVRQLDLHAGTLALL